MRDAEVRPEQNVSETQPIDIKITWTFAPKQALIEIKWLGKSKHPDGKLATTYGPARAQNGAQQLADYLDMNEEAVPGHVVRGYLVVFDGRRRRLGRSATSIRESDGLYYQDKEIHYEPAHDKERDDFEKPVRFFVQPVC